MASLTEGRIPATVLVGFLGAGKTTLLNRFLRQQQGRRYAVIVNDFSEIGIDARLVSQQTERVIELANGCICCTLREDLVAQLTELGRRADLDGIVIESTGLGEPLPIAQAFHMGELPERIALSEIVTVVDAANFWRDFAREDMMEGPDGEPTAQPLAPLLIDQLEFTDIVLLNKTDLATPEDVATLETFVRNLNPGAVLHRTAHGEIDPAEIHGTGRYQYDLGPELEAWEETWDLSPESEADEYGFHSFTYRAEAPFRFAAFRALFDVWSDDVLRAKGFVTFSDNDPVVLSVVRDQATVEVLVGEAEDAAATAVDDGPAVELIFIGRNMPVAVIRQDLDACLATA